MSIKKEILGAAGIKSPNKGETEAAFLRRVVEGISDKIDEEGDEVFESLSEEGQAWYSDAVKAIKRKKRVASIPGLTFDGASEEEAPKKPSAKASKPADDDDEEEEEKPKAKAAKPAAKPADDDDEEEEEEKPKAKSTKPAAKPADDDDDDEEEEKPKAKTAKPAAKPADDDDDEEEKPKAKAAKPAPATNAEGLKKRGGGKLFRQLYVEQVMRDGFEFDYNPIVKQVVSQGYAFTDSSAQIIIYEAEAVLRVLAENGHVTIPS